MGTMLPWQSLGRGGQSCACAALGACWQQASCGSNMCGVAGSRPRPKLPPRNTEAEGADCWGRPGQGRAEVAGRVAGLLQTSHQDRTTAPSPGSVGPRGLSCGSPQRNCCHLPSTPVMGIMWTAVPLWCPAPSWTHRSQQRLAINATRDQGSHIQESRVMEEKLRAGGRGGVLAEERPRCHSTTVPTQALTRPREAALRHPLRQHPLGWGESKLDPDEATALRTETQHPSQSQVALTAKEPAEGSVCVRQPGAAKGTEARTKVRRPARENPSKYRFAAALPTA